MLLFGETKKSGKVKKIMRCVVSGLFVHLNSIHGSDVLESVILELESQKSTPRNYTQ
jgi:hypothetical protein